MREIFLNQHEHRTYNKYLLEEISRLEDNWNNNGAEKFSQGIVDKMNKIVDKVQIQPDIFPTACNSIQFEYENSDYDYLEFNLFEDDRVEIYITFEGGCLETEIEFDMEHINEIVDVFFKTPDMLRQLENKNIKDK